MDISHVGFHSFKNNSRNLLYYSLRRIESLLMEPFQSHWRKKNRFPFTEAYMFQFFCASEADGVSCWHVEICIYFNSMPSRTSLSIQLKTPVQSFAKRRRRRYEKPARRRQGGKLNRIPEPSTSARCVPFGIRAALRGNQHTQIHKCLNKYAVSRFRSFRTLRR